jgi:hypothetical protein
MGRGQWSNAEIYPEPATQMPGENALSTNGTGILLLEGGPYQKAKLVRPVVKR